MRVRVTLNQLSFCLEQWDATSSCTSVSHSVFLESSKTVLKTLFPLHMFSVLSLLQAFMSSWTNFYIKAVLLTILNFRSSSYRSCSFFFSASHFFNVNSFQEIWYIDIQLIKFPFLMSVSTPFCKKTEQLIP